MNYKIIFISLLMTFAFLMQAQNDKLRIAVFDPTSSGTGIDEGTRMAVREIISSAFVNTGKYNIVERSLLERVMSEQAFSISGAVDDSQASEIGRLAGANKIVLSVITLAGGRNMLSIKLVDVNTASVERQRTQVIAAEELLSVVEPLTLELMGEESGGVRQIRIAETPVTQQPVQQQVVTQTPQQRPQQTTVAQTAGRLTSGKGGNVLQNGGVLIRSEIEEILSIDPVALRMYQSGRSKRSTGKILSVAGMAAMGVGNIMMAVGIDEDEEYLALAGLVVTGVGLPVGIVGFVLKGSGSRSIRNAVDTYNRRNVASHVEVNFVLTQNGIGLVMRF